MMPPDVCVTASDNEATVTDDGKVLLCLNRRQTTKEPADYETVDGNHIYDQLTVTVTDSDDMETSQRRRCRSLPTSRKQDG